MNRIASLVTPVTLLALATLSTACPKKNADVVDAGMSGNDNVPIQHSTLKAVFEPVSPADARAVELCNALVALPDQRRAACCQVPAGTQSFASTCAGILTSALQQHAVTIDDAKLTQCVADRTKQYDGCSWVGAIPLFPPPSCESVLVGDADEGARCRSSLECRAGLRCLGAGPLDVGRCARPLADGHRCGAAVDGLSVVVAQVAIDRAHPECVGVCQLGKCIERGKPGDTCVADPQCDPADRCEAGKCVKGRIALGKPCTAAACVAGSRCMDGVCVVPRKEGEACHNDFDCEQGGCVKNAAGASVCGMRCNVMP